MKVPSPKRVLLPVILVSLRLQLPQPFVSKPLSVGFRVTTVGPAGFALARMAFRLPLNDLRRAQ
jgi:hypothetical protein